MTLAPAGLDRPIRETFAAAVQAAGLRPIPVRDVDHLSRRFGGLRFDPSRDAFGESNGTLIAAVLDTFTGSALALVFTVSAKGSQGRLRPRPVAEARSGVELYAAIRAACPGLPTGPAPVQPGAVRPAPSSAPTTPAFKPIIRTPLEQAQRQERERLSRARRSPFVPRLRGSNGDGAGRFAALSACALCPGRAGDHVDLTDLLGGTRPSSAGVVVVGVRASRISGGLEWVDVTGRSWGTGVTPAIERLIHDGRAKDVAAARALLRSRLNGGAST
jgi:hypothetical protein